MIQREVREAGAGITAKEEGETKETRTCMQVLRLATPPSPTDIDISTDGDDIETADDMEHGGDFPDEVDDEDYGGESDEADDLSGVVLPFEAEGVEDLSNEKDKDADGRSVVDSEDNISDEGH